MSRVIGFSLKIEGQEKTIFQLNEIENKLKTVTLAIQAAKEAGAKGGKINIPSIQETPTQTKPKEPKASKPTAPDVSDIEAYKKYRSEQLALIEVKKQLDYQLRIEAKSFALAAQSIHPESIIGMRHEIVKLKDEYLRLSPAARKGAEGIEIVNKTARLNAEVSKAEQSLGDFRRNVGNYKSAFDNVGSVITGGLIGGGVVAATTLIVSGFNKMKNAAKEFTDIQADVRKTTGLTKKEISELSEEFKKFNTRTATTELLKIAAIGGQLGIEGKQGIKDFTKAIDVLVVSLGDELSGGAERITQDVGRLSNVLFGATTNGTELSENILHIGNALNVLSSTSAATSENLINFASRIGATLIPLGASAADVLALSATFDELNINAEKGSTAINNLVKDIGANTSLFSKTLGLNQEELKKTFNTSPLEAFQQVLNRVLQISGGDKTKTLELLKDLKQTGVGVGDIFLQMATRSEIFDRNLKNSNLAIKSTSSLLNEFAVKNDTVAGVFDRITKKLNDIGTNPKIISFFEKIGNIVLGTVNILSDAAAGISDFFDRISISTTVGGKKVESSFLGMNVAALSLNESEYILAKGTSDLNKQLITEEAIIKNSIKTLKDQNISNETRNKIIQTLVEKYPDLLKAQDLEKASNEELNNLQNILTENLRVQLFERIKLKTREALETELINQRIKKAELELGGGLTGTAEFLSNIFGRKEEVIEITKKQTDEAIKAAEAALKKSDEVFNKLAKDMGVSLSNIISTESTNVVVKSINDLNSKVSGGGKPIDEEEQKRLEKIRTEAAKTEEQLREQLIRIRQLKEQFKKTEIDLIQDEFEKKIKQIQLDADISIKEFQDNITAIKNKRDDKGNKIPLSVADKNQIAEIENLIEQAGRVSANAIQKVIDERTELFSNAAIELRKQSDELERIQLETNEKLTTSKLEDLNFDKSQTERVIKTNFSVDLSELDRQLASVELTEKKYFEKKNLLEKEQAKKELELLVETRQKTIDVYESQYSSSLSLLKANHKIRLREIEDAVKKEIEAIDKEEKARRIPVVVAEAQKKGAVSRGEKLSTSAELQFNIEAKKLQNDLLVNVQGVNDKINEATQNKVDKDLQTERKGVEERKQLIEELKQSALDFGSQLSSTLFEITRNGDEARLKNLNKNLEKEKASRLSLVKGNLAEEERLNREFDAKQEQIDREAFEREKQLRIQEAEINAALGITAVFAVPDFTFGVLTALRIAFILATTALQVSAIRSKQFAEGGWAEGDGGHTGAGKAPPDHTGKRPVGKALLHEKEYINPDWQVEQHPELFNAFEQDRLNRKYGRTGAVKKYIQSLAKAYAESKPDEPVLIKTRFRVETPILVRPSDYYSKRESSEIMLSKESITEIASTIALHTSRASGIAVYEGTKKGMSENELKEWRQQRMLKNRTA